MGNVERGVVKGSNQECCGGDRRANGFMGLAGGASTVHPSNETSPGGDRRGGSFPLGGGAAAIHPPDHRFSVESGVPGAMSVGAEEPGKGAVPVNPFLAGGAAARSMPVSDMAKAK
jgi:hypothetical protein